MRVLKLFLFFFMSIFIAGCAGVSGPIKGYNENLAVDKETLSTIYLPPEIEFLEVDGMEMKTPFIEEGYNEVHIPPGNHQVAVKYVAYWGDASTGSMVNSEPVVLGLSIAPKSTYYFRFKKSEDQWDAQNMADNFVPWLEDASGKKVKNVNNLAGGRLLTSGKPSMTGQQFTSGNTPLDKLKFWWKNAGYKEKKTFEKWMGNN